MQQGAYLRIWHRVIRLSKINLKIKNLMKFKMPQIFSPIDIKIALVLVAITLTFVIIGAIIWGIHPPVVSGG